MIVWRVLRVPLAPLMFLAALSGYMVGGWSQVASDLLPIEWQGMSEVKQWTLGGITGTALAASVIAGCMVGCPQYEVYRQGKQGEARLREAESSRQIAVQEANAKMESAKLLAQAEVERAKGVAEANKIIGEGLKGNHEYLMYLWIHAMADQNHQTIYVPTEAGLPILEASRFLKPKEGK